MQLSKKFCFLVAFSLALWGCSSGGGTGPNDGGNESGGTDNNPDPVEYSLSVLKSPSEGGIGRAIRWYI